MSDHQYDLDDVDRGILHMLQKDARDTSTREIGEAVGVSAGTVRNRIENLEEVGVLRGYVPDIDYERAGYQLRILFTCTATDPSDVLTRKVVQQHGVVTVRKLLAGEENYHVQAVATSTSDVSGIAGLIRGCGLDVVRTEVVDEELIRPFDHFGTETVDHGKR